MQQDEQEDCNLLAAPIALVDLIGRGATLQMNPHYEGGMDDEIYNEVYGFDGDDEDAENDQRSKRAQLVSPWLKSFDELKEKMLQIDEHIYKRIMVRGNMEKEPIPPTKSLAKIRYHSYWQGESEPFDSSALHGSGIFQFETGQENVLAGLEKAVCSMNEGEEAQFIISYKLLFGELGCPPRIKKRADALYVIELLSYKALDTPEQAVNVMPPEERTKFKNTLIKSKELHTQGLEFYRKGMYKNAVQKFVKASELLEISHLANEKDEQEFNEFIIKLYLNIAVIYNKMKLPKKTCLICQKIWQISDNRPPCKALFHKGRALYMLGDYQRAKELLSRALKLDPHNVVIQKELATVEERDKKFIESSARIQRNALNLEKIPESNEEPANLLEFKQNMQQILEDFKNNAVENLVLPASLTELEINAVNTLVQNFDLELTFSKITNSYYLKINEVQADFQSQAQLALTLRKCNVFSFATLRSD